MYVYIYIYISNIHNHQAWRPRGAALQAQHAMSVAKASQQELTASLELFRFKWLVMLNTSKAVGGFGVRLLKVLRRWLTSVALFNTSLEAEPGAKAKSTAQHDML